MLTPEQTIGIRNLLNWAQSTINGGCKHDSGICFCGVTANIIEVYDIWHSIDPSLHDWVYDYVWDDDGNTKRIQRCKKCYIEKPKN